MAPSLRGRTNTFTKILCVRMGTDRYITELLLDSNVLPKKGFPVMFHGIKGAEKRTRRSPSYFNIIEASVVRNYCVALTDDPEQRICECHVSLSFPVIF
jgi:helicase MOV-10